MSEQISQCVVEFARLSIFIHSHLVLYSITQKVRGDRRCEAFREIPITFFVHRMFPLHGIRIYAKVFSRIYLYYRTFTVI
jgi:hypothetical protein